MKQEDRINKYNAYKTKENLLAKKIHGFITSISLTEFQDLMFSTGYIEYSRYVDDCISLNEMPLRYSEWIEEQSKFNYKKD